MSAPATWHIGGASVRGTAHVRTQRPNQDATLWLPESGHGTEMVGAVSDGHGARPHFRAEIGAQLAVREAIALLGEVERHDEALAASLLVRWREAVAAHLAAHPLTEDESRISAPSEYIAYGATLIAAAATDSVFVALQIGDGDLFLGYPDGRIVRPLGTDEGLTGEQTYSLCLPDAASRFRMVTLWREDGVAWPDFVLLASDGVSKSFSDDAALVTAVAHFRQVALASWHDLTIALPGWLEDVSAHGSGDDSTICIAARPGITKGNLRHGQ